MMNFTTCILHRILLGWTCGTNGERRGVYRVLVGKPEGKETTGKT
jgi:hypothetical protein